MTRSACGSTRCRSHPSACSRRSGAKRRENHRGSGRRAFPTFPGPSRRAWRHRGRGETARRPHPRRRAGVAPDAAPARLQLSRAPDAGRGASDEAGRGHRGGVRRRRHRSLSEHEAAPAGAEDGDLARGARGAADAARDGRCGAGGRARRRPHAQRRVRPRRRASRLSGPGRRRRTGIDALAPQYGHFGRQFLPRHALQLLRSGVRVAQGNRLLHEEGRAHLLGRALEPALLGGELVRCRPGDGGPGGGVSARRPRWRAPGAGGRFYHNDGIDYLTKQPDEVLVEARLPAPDGWDAVYHKLRRRGSFDFPVLGVAAWVRWRGERGARVAEARIVLGGVASYPQEVPEAGAALREAELSAEAIAAAADAAYRPAKPMDNTDFDLSWRKQMTRVYVTRALTELAVRRGPAAATGAR